MDMAGSRPVPLNASVALNASSPLNASLLLNASFRPPDCLTFTASRFIFTAFSVSHILVVLPLIGLVFCLGVRRWRRRRRISSVSGTSHADVFTHHMAAVELVAVVGCLFYCVGVNTNCPEIFTCGFYMFSSTWCAKTFFHLLTCVERYLAVVHPVTYRSLKDTGGIVVRNSSLGLAWLLCLVWGLLMSQVHFQLRMMIFFSHIAFILASVCFCCLRVLQALRRPGPGGAGGSRQRADPLKRRAFNTVLSIMAVLWLCLAGMLLCYALVESLVLSEDEKCMVRGAVNWFSLPSSLVLPLLYLHRAGKLPRCC